METQAKQNAPPVADDAKPARWHGVRTAHWGIGLSILFGTLALYAGHLYYLEDGELWAMGLTAVALLALGFAAKVAAGRTAQDAEDACPGDVALGAGVIVLVIVVLLWLPLSVRVEQRADFSSLVAMDAKINGLVKGRAPDSTVLRAVGFDGFASGSDLLNCDGVAARKSLDALYEGLGRARERGQRSMLILIGTTDRMPLAQALQKRYGSNAGLAVARAEAVRACLTDVRRDVRRLTDEMESVRLASGPSYTPPSRESAPADATGQARDRQVNAFLVAVPSPASAPASQPPAPPKPQASQPHAYPREAATLGWRLGILAVGTFGLTLITVLLWSWIRRHPRPQSNLAHAAVTTSTPPNLCWSDALSHVRDMHEMFAELRTKNFNFFIVIVAAAIAGAAGITEKANLTLQFISSLAAAVSCVVFYGIEKRTVEMLGDARLELERLEPLAGVYLSRRDKWVGPSNRRRYVTHTRLYALAFMIVYFSALASIYLHAPW